MKKLALLALASLALILASCTKSCNSQKSTKKATLRIGTNANFPPYEFINNMGKLVGFDIDLGKALAKKLSLEAEYKEFDFDALILALKQGQIDIILSGLSITQSRLQEINMPPYQGKPLTEMAIVFWQKLPENISDTASIKRLSDQAALKVSVQAGHYLEGFLRDENINIKPLAGPPEQILDIKYKKSWCAVLDVANAQKMASEHTELKVLKITLPEDKWDLGLGVGIAKNNSELTQKITEALEELKADGSIAALEKLWFEGEH